MYGRQSVCFVATSDIAAKIQHTNQQPLAPAAAQPATGSGASGPCDMDSSDGRPITALNVMNWVMGNTVAATQQGVLEWAAQVCAACC